MDTILALLAALGLGILCILTAYPVAKRYIAYMQGQKKKHPNIAYVLADIASGAYWGAWNERSELGRSTYPWLPKVMLFLSLVCLIAGLILGYWEAWVLLALYVIAAVGAYIIAIRNSPKDYPVNKPKK